MRGGNRFYLDVSNPATSAGNVSVLQYCYVIPSEDVDNCCQSTVAIYRPQNGSIYRRIPGSGNYLLSPNSDILNADSDGSVFDCQNMTLESSVKVESDDVIGACVSSFNRVDSLGIAVENNQQRSLFRSLGSETGKYCGSPGVSPQEVDKSRLVMESTSLLLFALIYSKWISLQIKIIL